MRNIYTDNDIIPRSHLYKRNYEYHLAMEFSFSHLLKANGYAYIVNNHEINEMDIQKEKNVKLKEQIAEETTNKAIHGIQTYTTNMCEY